MSMNKLMGCVEKLVNQEYELSSKDHGEQFASYHEAYAVIKEEIEETQKELGDLYKHFSIFWNGVKHDAIPADEIKHIARSAHLAACELIQVTAMAYKATLGLKGDKTMSLLIKGIDMPEKCQYCPCCYHDEREPSYEATCSVWGDRIPDMTAGRIDECPMIEIDTPHGDLIDRDDLLSYFKKKSKGKTAEEVLKLLYTALKAYPTVIEAEE